MKKDILWWIHFMEQFDGITLMPPINWDAPDVVFSSDACLTRLLGLGARRSILQSLSTLAAKHKWHLYQ